jgi:hypothetical protein
MRELKEISGISDGKIRGLNGNERELNGIYQRIKIIEVRELYHM